MPNAQAKLYARGLNVPLWKYAQYKGVSEMTITRRLRKEFTPAELEEWKHTIDQIAEGKQAEK